MEFLKLDYFGVLTFLNAYSVAVIIQRADCTDSLDIGNASEVDKIRSRSEQRYPMPGEPVCVVCGKYGEYICNEVSMSSAYIFVTM